MECRMCGKEIEQAELCAVCELTKEVANIDANNVDRKTYNMHKFLFTIL